MRSDFPLPQLARPALVAWLPGGRQDFPADPTLDRARHEQLKRAGLIHVRRIPAQEVM